MRRVLIIGSSGQDGKILNRILKVQTDVLINLDKRGIFINEKILVDYDNLRITNIFEILSQFRINEIIFFASFSKSQNDRLKLNVQVEARKHTSVENLLEKIVLAVTKLDYEVNFTFASSSLRFGQLKGIINENTIVRPDSLYGIHKLKCEEIINKALSDNRSVHTKILIFFNHISSESSVNYFLPKLVKNTMTQNIDWIDKQLLVEAQSPNFIDVGHAFEFMRIVSELSLLQKSDFFVIATGHTYPISYFLSLAKSLIFKRKINENILDAYSIPFQANITRLRSTLRLQENRLIHGEKLFNIICREYSGLL